MSGAGGRGGEEGPRAENDLSAVELVAVARVAKARGVRGEVAADIWTDFPERFERLEELIAVFPGGERRRLALEGHWLHGDRVVLKFKGFDSPEEASSSYATREAEKTSSRWPRASASRLTPGASSYALTRRKDF